MCGVIGLMILRGFVRDFTGGYIKNFGGKKAGNFIEVNGLTMC